MNPKSLSKDMARAIVEALVAEGAISEDRIVELLKLNPSDGLKQLVDLTHQVFCARLHPEECLYSAEDALDTVWQEDFHKVWLNITLDLMQKIGVSNEDEFLRCYRQTNDLVAQLAQLEHTNLPAFELFLLRKGLTRSV